MSRIETGWHERDPDTFADGFWSADASDKAVEKVLAADPDSGDGRSQWLWIRLPNGDLVLAVYPQGDTYFDTEDDRQI